MELTRDNLKFLSEIGSAISENVPSISDIESEFTSAEKAVYYVDKAAQFIN
jgi:hypothetical protein